ncbi:MAG: hypothetical protein R8K20_05430 [Gallionellaceae bacterium]
MKNRFALLGVLGVFLSAMSIEAIAADNRIIEDTLIYKDPTVASAGQWVFGGALEGFFVSGTETGLYHGYCVCGSPGLTPQSGNVNTTKPGINLFVGRGNFTVNYAYRSSESTTQYSGVFSENVTRKAQEHEITARWLIRDLATSFTPYLYGGYLSINEDTSSRMASGANYSYNGKAVSPGRGKIDGLMLGIGAIIPVNEKMGFRVDGGISSLTGTYTRDDSYVGNGKSTTSRFTGTMYYNLPANWNVQGGARVETLKLGDMGQRVRRGVFGMIGYSFR